MPRGMRGSAELVRCDFCSTRRRRGAAGGLRASYAVSIGEKGVFRFTLTTEGVASHASVPMGADNALLKLAPLLDAMATGRPGLDVTRSSALFTVSASTSIATPRKRCRACRPLAALARRRRQ